MKLSLIFFFYLPAHVACKWEDFFPQMGQHHIYVGVPFIVVIVYYYKMKTIVVT
jgi:hypothetical protein